MGDPPSNFLVFPMSPDRLTRYRDMPHEIAISEESKKMLIEQTHSWDLFIKKKIKNKAKKKEEAGVGRWRLPE